MLKGCFFILIKQLLLWAYRCPCEALYIGISCSFCSIGKEMLICSSGIKFQEVKSKKKWHGCSEGELEQSSMIGSRWAEQKTDTSREGKEAPGHPGVSALWSRAKQQTLWSGESLSTGDVGENPARAWPWRAFRECSCGLYFTLGQWGATDYCWLRRDTHNMAFQIGRLREWTA